MGILQNCDTRLEERLELHRLWLDHAAGGVRADLTGAVLSDLKLDKADLRGAILRETAFLDSSLCGSDLTGADCLSANAFLAISVWLSARITGPRYMGTITELQMHVHAHKSTEPSRCLHN